MKNKTPVPVQIEY